MHVVAAIFVTRHSIFHNMNEMQCNKTSRVRRERGWLGNNDSIVRQILEQRKDTPPASGSCRMRHSMPFSK